MQYMNELQNKLEYRKRRAPLKDETLNSALP